MRRFLLILALLAFPGAAAADVAVDEKRLEDPVLEAKAREIMEGLRCLVCQNQSIEDSNAGLAQDLRRIVREQVAEGRSQSEIEAYLVERYGDWVLLQPPLNLRTVLLWVFPPLVLAIVAGAALLRARRKRAAGRTNDKSEPEALTSEERARLETLLGEEGR